MLGINKMALGGRLTRDPELKEVKGIDGNTTFVVNNTLAVDRDYFNKEGKPVTDFLDFVIWGKSAERLSQNTKKGSYVYIEGTLQQDRDKETNRSFIKIVAKDYKEFDRIMNKESEKSIEEVIEEKEPEKSIDDVLEEKESEKSIDDFFEEEEVKEKKTKSKSKSKEKNKEAEEKTI